MMSGSRNTVPPVIGVAAPTVQKITRKPTARMVIRRIDISIFSSVARCAARRSIRGPMELDGGWRQSYIKRGIFSRLFFHPTLPLGRERRW